jgi:FMN phosphatase YigB (HAD superfamily)
MKALILDVMGVLVSDNSLLDHEEFIKICDDIKSKGEFIVLYSNSTSKVADHDPLHKFAKRYVNDGYFNDNGQPIKPSQESFQAILELHDLAPEECVYIDDAAHNIEIAKKIGFKTILFSNPLTVIEKLKEITTEN